MRMYMYSNWTRPIARCSRRRIIYFRSTIILRQIKSGLLVVLVTKTQKNTAASVRVREEWEKIFMYTSYLPFSLDNTGRIYLASLLFSLPSLPPSLHRLRAATSWRFNKVNPREVFVPDNVLLHYSLRFSLAFPGRLYTTNQWNEFQTYCTARYQQQQETTRVHRRRYLSADIFIIVSPYHSVALGKSFDHKERVLLK